MAYFKWIQESVLRLCSVKAEDIVPDAGGGGDVPWYIIPVPKVAPHTAVYDWARFSTDSTWEIIKYECAKNLHFTKTIDKTGHEGLYGLFQYLHLPDYEIGLDLDVATFYAGAIGAVSIGLYLDDINPTRKFFAWWPVRWYYHFLEEGIYLHRSIRWFLSSSLILIKILIRVLYGTFTHVICRMLYFWAKNKLGAGNYAPLFDDTFAALITSYFWTSGMITEEFSLYDRLITAGWTGFGTGLLEYGLGLYYSEKPKPGLFRWCCGGAYYGPGFWRYLSPKGKATSAVTPD